MIKWTLRYVANYNWSHMIKRNEYKQPLVQTLQQDFTKLIIVVQVKSFIHFFPDSKLRIE